MNEQMKVAARRKLAAWMENTGDCRAMGFSNFWNGSSCAQQRAMMNFGTTSGQAQEFHIKGPEQGSRPGGGSLEARCQLEWQRNNSELTSEFDSYEQFYWYSWAVERKLVRMTGKGRGSK